MILQKILEADQEFGLFSAGATVTVACSGGADSMALLHALMQLQDELHITVQAAHYNHGIRGVEADRDETFVKEFCKHNRISFVFEKGDVPTYAKENGLGLETAARELRYAFLERISPDGLIATAHTASDQLETVLLHLVRGAGMAGLCGIPPKRGKIVRPLLLCTRAEIEAYCIENGLNFVLDSTNDDDICARNRIRHTVVPILKELNPSVEDAVLRASSALRADQQFLDEQANKAVSSLPISDKGYDVSPLRRLPRAVVVRVLQKIALKQFDEELDYLHCKQLLEICMHGGKISLPKKYTASVQDGFLKFSDLSDKKVQFSLNLAEKSITFCEENKKINNLLFKNTLDCDKIIGQLSQRTRKAGDTVCIRKLGGTKTLKKLYNEYHIPLDERENLPILEDDDGIVWIAKIGVAERCAVDNKTKRIIEITLRGDNEIGLKK
ncbi:MAG: tRNA lysidine(34) synthetase TilS [Clostridia bacterium]|nr:tRNA lysidine(34) synthetase TilS [Clostridia bacterium]